MDKEQVIEAIRAFHSDTARSWEQLYSVESWNANQWVWVIDFEVV